MQGLRLIWDAIASVVAEAIIDEWERKRREIDDAELEVLERRLSELRKTRNARAN